MRNNQRVTALELSSAVQPALTEKEYQSKHELFNKSKVELLGYSENDLIPFSNKMYQEYLNRYGKGTKMTSQEKRKKFKELKCEILRGE